MNGADVKEQLAFYLCKSGGIHIIEFDCDIVTHDVIEGLGMYFVNGHCEEKFSDSSKTFLSLHQSSSSSINIEVICSGLSRNPLYSR